MSEEFWKVILLALISATPAIIAAISSLRNGQLLNGTKKKVSELQKNSLLTTSDNILHIESDETDQSGKKMFRGVPRARAKGKGKKSSRTQTG